MRCSAGGCDFAEDPAHPIGGAAVFWRQPVNPRILPIVAVPATADAPDVFDVARAPCRTNILRIEGVHEHVTLDDGFRSLQLALTEGTLLRGPVRLRYDLYGARPTNQTFTSLHQLTQLIHHGEFESEHFPRAQRWAMALRALDLIADGASYQDVAIELFGVQPGHRSWRIDNEPVRNRVRRIIETGQAMVAGGYLKILQM